MRTFFAALLLAAVATAQSFDEQLPDATVFYVSIENAARTKERYGASPLAALWKDEAMQAFLEKPRAKWAEWEEKAKQEGMFTPDDVLELYAGQAVVAGWWPEGSKDLAVLALADIGDHGEKLREVVAKFEKKVVEERGNRRDEEEFRGVKIVSYAKETEAGVRRAGAWFLDGTTLGIAEGPDALKDVLARKERREEGTLASRDLYRRTRERLGARGGDLFLYVDAPNLFAGLQRSGEMDENDMRILGLLGLGAAEALAMEFAIEPRGIAVRFFLGVKGPKMGVLKLLDGKNSALLPPRYTPGDALTSGSWTIDLPAIWEEGRRVADKIEQGSTAQMDAVFEMIKAQTGVDVPADLIASLGSEITYHTRPLEKAAEGEESDDEDAFRRSFGAGQFVLSVQLRDRERFEGALDKLLTAAGGAAAQDYLGVKLRTIATPIGIQPAMAVLPDRFLFALTADDAKDVIARYGKEAKGLLDREDLAKALAALPAQRFMVSVEDMPKSLANASSTFATAMSLVARAGGPRELAGFVDFSRFPSAEVLAKYLGWNVGCVVNEEDGISYLSVLHLNG